MYVNMSPCLAKHHATDTYAGAKKRILTLIQMAMQVQLRELAALLHNKVCKSVVLRQIFI
jgi:hypothetical protein